MGLTSYVRSRPSLQGAAFGNRQQMFQSLVHFGQRISDLEKKQGGGAINLKSPSPIATPPPFAKVGVTAGGGRFIVQVTNPQYKNKNAGNLQHGTIYHKIEFSPFPNFAQAVALPVSTQTYYEVSQFGSSTKYVRIRSSFDGKSFNLAQVLGPHKS